MREEGAGPRRGAGLIGPFKALTSRGGSGTPLSLPPHPRCGHGPGGPGLPSSAPDLGEFRPVWHLTGCEVGGRTPWAGAGECGVKGSRGSLGLKGQRGFRPTPRRLPVSPAALSQEGSCCDFVHPYPTPSRP